MRRTLRDALAEGDSPLSYPEHLINDLEPAAISLRPEVGGVLEALREAGAAHAMVTGSGPTAFGLFPSRGDAAAAAESLRARFPLVLATVPVRP
jgi:4-diphosphocytidyl-2-C-methyl-D-erythritol kinase